MWTAAGSLLNSLAGRSPRKQTVSLSRRSTKRVVIVDDIGDATQEVGVAGGLEWQAVWRVRARLAIARDREEQYAFILSANGPKTSRTALLVNLAQKQDDARCSLAPHNHCRVRRMKQSELRFPCIGAECAAAGTWHEAGTVCRSYRDAVRYDGKKCAWQRMCEGCADAGARLWTPSPTTTFASAGPAWDDVDDDEMDRQVADAEARYNAGRACRASSTFISTAASAARTPGGRGASAADSARACLADAAAATTASTGRAAAAAAAAAHLA